MTSKRSRNARTVVALSTLFGFAFFASYAFAVTYFGNDNANTCPTTDNPDTCHMRGGPDTAYGRGGGDSLHMGDGYDYAEGGAGGDLVQGGPVGEYVYGNTGNDSVQGEDGSDAAVDGNSDFDGDVFGGHGGDKVVTWDGNILETARGGVGDQDLCIVDWTDNWTDSCEAVQGH